MPQLRPGFCFQSKNLTAHAPITVAEPNEYPSSGVGGGCEDRLSIQRRVRADALVPHQCPGLCVEGDDASVHQPHIDPALTDSHAVGRRKRAALVQGVD